MRRARSGLCAVALCAQALVAGRMPAGELQILAAKRHLEDLRHGGARGLRFDEDAAARGIKFFSLLKHSKGKWAGKPLELAPWQQFIIGSIDGWKREDGTRRFRTAYIEVPRKNGKSTLAAGLALKLAFADGEPGAEVYCAATKRDQAKIVFEETRRMVLKTSALKKRIGVFKHNLSIPDTACKLEPLGADADTLDGLNIHGAVVDELHAHKTRSMVDVLETATGARAQPLIFYITTAGFDRHSVCWDFHAYTEKVLRGVLQDDTIFGYIACADPEDDWREQATWAKANPNLGISVMLDDLARKAKRAEQMPAAQNGFRRLHLDQWTEQATRWLDMEVWDACALDAVEPEELRGRVCFAGLDLGSTRDLSACVLLFPDDDGAYDVLPFFWIPEDGMRQRVERDRVPYDLWVDQGLIKVTPGNVTDYDRIREDLRELSERYQIKEIAFDPWHATQLATQLTEDGATMVEFRQGFASMAAPMKELERLLLAGKFRHGANPVLRWMASNVTVKADPAGNLKPDKEKSIEKIDGIVGAAMGLGRAMVHGEGDSVYEDRGLFQV